jgi:N-acetylmuramoyl-L-alanine amidase
LAGNAAHKRSYCGFAILSAVLFFVAAASPAFASVDVTDISYWSYPDYTRVVISLSDRTDFSRNRLAAPDRLYFDIKGSRIAREIKANLPVGNGMLKGIRAGQFNDSTVRVVLDLEKVKEYKVISMEDPVRIVIDIYGHAVASVKRRIVIDAGHGGHDPGAVGPNKLCEKDVVLDIALKLKKLLANKPNLEIFLTRDKDVYLKLEERTAIANSKNADLFVSVHANASPNRTARGVETYFLNWTDDEEAMKVAARENQISLKKMKKLRDDRDYLDVTLGDLHREFKRDESVKLANYIQKAMVGDLSKSHSHVVDLKVKWAPFYVLFGAQMPSVLVEVSFISNPLEERLLSKDSYRVEVARSIAAGIDRYMSLAPDTPTVAGAGVGSAAGN